MKCFSRSEPDPVRHLARAVFVAVGAALLLDATAAFCQDPIVAQLGNFSAAENRSVTPPPSSTAKAPETVLRLDASTAKAALTALSWDTEGGGRAKTNLLRAPVQLNATIAGRKVPLVDSAIEFARPADDCVRYKIAAARDISIAWEIRGPADHWSMSFDWGDARGKGLERLELVFPLDPGATPTTFISEHWVGNAGVRLPGIFSAPDLGQYLVTSPDRPDMAGRLEGSRSRKTVDLTFELPVDAEQHGVALSFSPLVLPTPPEVSPEIWAKARRGWFNLFNLSAAWTRPNGALGAPAGVFANNVISDPVSSLLYCHSDPVVLVPQLAPGVNAARVLRHTLDFWLDSQIASDGRVYYIPEGAADGNPSTGAPIMDSNPALLIAIWDYVEASDDLDWLLARIDRIERVADFLANRDLNHDGLVESIPSGNEGSNAFGDTYMDTISSGHDNALCNALTYRAWRHLSQLESRIGRGAQQERYDTLARALRAAYEKAFYNPDTGWCGWWRGADGSRHDYAPLIVNCYAVECGLVDRQRGREMLSRLWSKMEQVGFRRFDLGVPNNLIPVRRDEQFGDYGGKKDDGSDTFQHYCNGGVFPEDAVRCIAALYLVGESAKAETVFQAMLKRQHEGGFFPNGSGFNAGVTNRPNTGPSISDWDGNPTEYEGFIPRDYAFLSGAFLREPQLRKKIYAHFAPGDNQ